MLKKGKKRLFRIEIPKNMLTYQHWRGIIILHAHLNVGNILHEILILIKQIFLIGLIKNTGNYKKCILLAEVGIDLQKKMKNN